MWQIIALWVAVLTLVLRIAHRRSRQRTLQESIARRELRTRTALAAVHLQETFARLANDANDMVDAAIASQLGDR